MKQKKNLKSHAPFSLCFQMILSVLNAKYDLVCATYNKESWTKPEELRVSCFSLLKTYDGLEKM